MMVVMLFLGMERHLLLVGVVVVIERWRRVHLEGKECDCCVK
jgi:hypothetical protein